MIPRPPLRAGLLLAALLLLAACAQTGGGCAGPRRPANPHGSVLSLAPVACGAVS